VGVNAPSPLAVVIAKQLVRNHINWQPECLIHSHAYWPLCSTPLLRVF
jgi:hypothetical protein